MTTYDFDDDSADTSALTPTNAAILRPDGTAALIRIIPDTDTINAVVEAWAYGISPNHHGVTFWAAMPQAVFITSSNEPMGVGERNPLAEQVYQSVSGQKQQFLGTVVAVGGDLDAAVMKHAASVQDLRNPVRYSLRDEYADFIDRE